MTGTSRSEPDSAAPPAITADQAAGMMGSRRYVTLLVIVAGVGVIVSFVTWGFLELLHQITQELYTHLPHALGYSHGPPVWWPLPVLGIAGVIVAVAITRLPGNGGHIPAKGLSGGKPATPVELPGVLLAATVGIAFGIVLGPEAPLMALGPALAVLTVKLLRRDTPPQALQIVGAAGAFAAISFLFVNPLVAAILMIEVTGIGGARLPLVIVPGLLAAGIGSLLAIGIGSWTGLNRSAIALGPIQHLPHFGAPTVGEFGWTIAFAIAIGICVHFVLRGGLLTLKVSAPRPLIVLPIVGLIVAGLAIAFSQAEGHSVNYVLFSGESSLSGLVAQAGGWSIAALVLLVVFKALAYCLSLGSFRGGPTFPAIFLGAAGGILASHLPGFPVTAAVAVGMGAATAAVLRLPLSAIALATLLTVQAGTGDEPLIIVGVVVAYLVTLLLSRRGQGKPSSPDANAPGSGAGGPVPATAAAGEHAG
ncbi:MAG TPA: chloride channel protein [Solirubrobacteraceae bacterium]|jgi:H+/Cl- antiporter ClcA